MLTPITLTTAAFSVNFNTGMTPDADDCWWTMSVPREWASPPIQLDLSEPTVAPGADVAANRRRAWPMVARWRARCPSRAAAWAAWERSQQMPGDGLDKVATLLVGEPTPKWVQVIQASLDAPAPKTSEVRVEAEFVVLYPFKRGADERTETLAAGQTKTLTNAGTRAAPLTITTTGSGDVELRQETSGQVLATRTSVASGTVFDSYEQTVHTSGGLEVFPMGSPSEWLAIPGGSVGVPGGTDITNLGTAPVLVSWHDTY